MAKRKAWLVKRVQSERQMDDWNTVRGKWGQFTHRVRVKGGTRELDGNFQLEYHDERGKRCRAIIGPDVCEG